jgi:uncharacterized protein YjiS (DUF1127 family)
MIIQALFQTIDNLFKQVERARMAHRTFLELSQLTDRELSDLGLSRHDIALLAYGLK